MYFAKQPYKCIKCRYEFEFSPHESHPAPVDWHGNPVCPSCWNTFLAFVGLGYQTTAWSKDGSKYEQKEKEALCQLKQ